ncbi:MAG: hypothetical protein HYZ16_06825 [Bacteroidetes bacterium]|jgi:hypothetical protein|nr:hypothetical protein [Bacteroidota bacterium]
MSQLKTFILLASTLGFMAVGPCAKEKPDPDDQPADTQKPTLEWVEILASMYPVGAQVPLHFEIQDNVALSTATLTVTNSSIDSVYVLKSYTSTEKYLLVDEEVTVALTTTMADFIVKVDAIDKAGNKESFIKGFHVMN